jgi:hypothetical protein
MAARPRGGDAARTAVVTLYVEKGGAIYPESTFDSPFG